MVETCFSYKKVNWICLESFPEFLVTFFFEQINLFQWIFNINLSLKVFFIKTINSYFSESFQEQMKLFQTIYCSGRGKTFRVATIPGCRSFSLSTPPSFFGSNDSICIHWEGHCLLYVGFLMANCFFSTKDMKEIADGQKYKFWILNVGDTESLSMLRK